jgi:hypothetical protein
MMSASCGPNSPVGRISQRAATTQPSLRFCAERKMVGPDDPSKRVRMFLQEAGRQASSFSSLVLFLDETHRSGFSLIERRQSMMVLTKRASEEVVIDKPRRVVVLETAPDKVKLGLLDTGDDFRESFDATFSDPDRHTGRSVKIIAPYGEEIEIDC